MGETQFSLWESDSPPPEWVEIDTANVRVENHETPLSTRNLGIGRVTAERHDGNIVALRATASVAANVTDVKITATLGG